MNDKTVFCIDCDGTLIKTDLLHEAVLILLKQSPIKVFSLFFWLLKGKFYLKERLAETVRFNYSTLPYNKEILNLIEEEKTKGRRIVLATASPYLWAEGIANHLNLFDEVIATDIQINLAGKNKAIKLVELYGERGFSYAGNSHKDLHIWKYADSATIVSSNSRLKRKAEQETEVAYVFESSQATIFTYIKALRLYQWLKNLLIFIPILAAHKFGDAEILINSMLGFLSFGLCASAGYVLNDLLDLESDRLHVRKCKRPFASAVIPIWHGIVLFPLLLFASFLIAFWLPDKFVLVLILYFFLTIIYSIVLKKQVIVDVMLLATLYTLRIIAGSAGTGIIPSFWLLAFSMFIFLSLAIVKRYSELQAILQQNKNIPAGRGYSVNDINVLMSLGVSAGMASVLVLALYINNPDASGLYPYKLWLWILPPLLLYWISRVWMKSHRGEIHDDPVVFAATDWQSLVLLLIAVLIFLSALKVGYFYVN
jgi:4-hydroxybenzoate polyprenyltransferase/phosphoserine phosphatase